MERIRAVASASVANPYAWTELRGDVLAVLDGLMAADAAPSPSVRANHEFIRATLSAFDRYHLTAILYYIPC